jgi:hypothetical protein
MNEQPLDRIHVNTVDVGNPTDTGILNMERQPILGKPNTQEDLGRIKDVVAAWELAYLEDDVHTAQKKLDNREKELSIAVLNENKSEEKQIPQPLPIQTNEAQAKSEILPPIQITAPIFYAGKYFQTDAATDHFGDPHIKSLYDRDIVMSEWAEENIYHAHARYDLRTANFSEPRPRIYGVFRTDQGLMQVNIKWCTEGDYAREKGVKPSAARPFPNTEIRLLNGKEHIIDLNAKGYCVLSALTSTENINWIIVNGKTRAYNANGRTSQNNAEVLDIKGNEPSLWQDRQWLEKDALVASIADTYKNITSGKLVRMVKPESTDPKKSVLVAEAICQMTSSRLGKLICWITERGILRNQKFHLSFIDGPNIMYPTRDEVLVNPDTSIITQENSALVEQIREAFSKPLPVALKVWKNQLQ